MMGAKLAQTVIVVVMLTMMLARALSAVRWRRPGARRLMLLLSPARRSS